MNTLKIMTRKIASRLKGKEMDIEAYFEFFDLRIINRIIQNRR